MEKTILTHHDKFLNEVIIDTLAKEIRCIQRNTNHTPYNTKCQKIMEHFYTECWGYGLRITNTMPTKLSFSCEVKKRH